MDTLIYFGLWLIPAMMLVATLIHWNKQEPK